MSTVMTYPERETRTMTPTKLPDGYFETVYWLEKLKERNNETFMPLFFDKHRHLVIMGGGGSGKSIFAGDKVLQRCSTEEGHTWLVCRKVANTIRYSCFNQLVGQANEHYSDEIERIYGGDMRITFRNGSQIIFAGLDDVEKLKSIYNITGIWIEEASEISEQDFNQLDIRLRGETKYYKQIILTFNPVSILHWLKRRFFDKTDVKGNRLPKDITKLIRTHHSTYRDNRFLPEEDRKTLENFAYTDPYYYQVYALGQWGVLGKSVFDAQAISGRLLRLPKAHDRGRFEYTDYGTGIKGIRWTSDKDGWITIYSPVKERRHYVIGADTAGTGSDSFVGQVLDNFTGEQVSVLRHQFGEDEFAKQLYCLGVYYNDALIGVETNYSTYPVRELERLRYKKQYVRETFDNYTHKTRKSFGFETTSKTRPVIISNLITWARENIDSINDKVTLEEMLTFVRNEDFRPEAEEGAHDDCVMALAIAHYIRPQQKYQDEPQSGSGMKWTEDMLADYRRGNAEQKAIMRQMWGEPN